MPNFGRISVLKRRNTILSPVSLHLLAFFVLLLFAVTAPAFAEDMDPPDFAGAMQSGAAFWEFSADSDQPTSYYYIPPLVDPRFGFRYYWGAWQWQSGAGIAGDGAMLLFDEESFVQPIPDGDGDFITIYVQLTWQGAEPDLGIGLEIWADPYGWTPGEEFEEEHLDGAEWPDPIDEYDLGGGWTQSTFAATFWSWEVAYVHIILHMDIWYDLLIDEVVVDMVIHDDFPPPVGPGRPGGAGIVQIIGEWEDESSDLSRPKEAGFDRALIFTAHTEDTTETDMNLTSVTYGGQAMTKVIDRNVADSNYRAYVAAFVLDEAGIAAASGGTFEVTWEQAPSNMPGYSSAFFSGVNQDDLVGASDSADGVWLDTVATSPLATNEGEMVIVAATAGNNGDYQVKNDFTEAVEMSPQSADGITGFKPATGADETPKVTLTAANRQAIIGFVLQIVGPDTSPPEPDPMSWEAAPYAIGRTSIAMIATTASDRSGVRYYFDETSGNSGGSDSSWQMSEYYTDTGLTADTQYTYRVKAQDWSVNKNETAWSIASSATTDPPDTEPPIPDPALWVAEPMALGPFSIGMLASEADDESGVQYYFEETSGNEGGAGSGWQSSRSYINSRLTPQTQYTYRVKARDQSPQFNETDWSALRSATTDEAPVLGCPDGDLDNDCDCDIDDLRLFAGQWLDGPGCINHTMDCADIDGHNDGVDSQDFAVLAAGWLQEGANLVINEMMADNEDTIADEYGEYDDWIELFNPTGATIDLGGMYLADNDGNIWMIPPGTTIMPGEYKLFWADGDWLTQGNNHTNFALSRNGDGVTLYDTDGTTPIDSKSFAEMHDDISYGRFPDAIDNWYDMTEPTPGLPNKIGSAGGVYFSHPGGTFTGSFTLGLATPSPTATIYYTLNGDEPSDAFGSTSFEYTGPITISETTWVRARAYEQDLSPSLITSKTYIKLATDVQSFQSNLPIVIIDSFGWDIDDLDRDFYPVSAVFIDTDEVTGICAITDPVDWAGCGGMHIRGNSTTDYDKKQYRFETWDENVSDPDPKARYTDLDVSLLGFPAESDWIIHGPYSDKTLMRNYQMFTWSRQIGRYAVRTKFVEVFLDYDGDGQVEWEGGWEWAGTDYRGVYIFMEKIKRGDDRVDIARLDPSDNAEPEISGGYILKKDWGGDGFMTETYDDWIMYEDPRFEELTWQQRDWIEAYFNEFEGVLDGPSFDDPCNGYVQYIDVGSFVDHHILVEIAKNVDGFVLSTFLYKDRGGKINMGPIWDYNGSLGGADYFCNYDPIGWLYEFNPSCWNPCAGEYAWFPADNENAYNWYWRLFEDTEFLLKYADQWFELREHDFKTANMMGDINNNVTVLTTDVGESTPVGRNFTRWDVLEDELWPNYYDNGCEPGGYTYIDYVNWMKNWISDRLTWMDSEIDTSYGDAPPDIKVNGVNKNRGDYIWPDDYISLTSNGGTIYYTTDSSDPREHGGAISSSASAYSSPFVSSWTIHIKARTRYSENDWSALNEATFATVIPVDENLRITEIMYHPQDPNHEFIELKNISSYVLSLNFVKFTDGIDFTFPNSAPIGGTRVVIVRNAEKFAERYPSFSGIVLGEFTGALNNAGERIELQDALGQVILNFRFKDGWYPITDGEGFSLNIIDPTNPDPNSWEYAEYWQPSSVAGGTPGKDDTGHVASPGDIVINEVMTHTNSYPNDWIELHNTTSSTIDITGWFLSDDPDNFKRYEIQPGDPRASIPGGGYVVFTQDDDFGNAGDPGSDVQFGLSELGETVYLCSGAGGELAGGFCAKEDFKASEDEVSFGRYTKSAAAAYDVDFVSMSSATYEAENTTGAKVGPVVITEIMYHPASNNYAEYVELKNISGGTVLLDSWKFTDENEGIEYYIPSGTSLASGQYLLLVKHKDAFGEQFTAPGGVTILQWLEGRLSNAGEKIQISKPGNPEPTGFVPYIRVDRVNYSDGSHGANFRELGYNDPWPPAPDGTGLSLQRVIDGNYGNDVANWIAAAPTPGEGAVEPGPLSVDLNMDDLWMYQNLSGSTNSELTTTASIIGDPGGNSSYSYTWEFILPDDVIIEPSTVTGGGASDTFWNFAAPNVNQPQGLSDSGQAITVRVTVTGDDYGNTGLAEAQFGIALLGDVNNETNVNIADRSIINAFWRTGSAGNFTLRDCDINSDGAVNIADRSIANAVWRGSLGQNSVTEPCPFR